MDTGTAKARSNLTDVAFDLPVTADSHSASGSFQAGYPELSAEHLFDDGTARRSHCEEYDGPGPIQRVSRPVAARRITVLRKATTRIGGTKPNELATFSLQFHIRPGVRRNWYSRYRSRADDGEAYTPGTSFIIRTSAQSSMMNVLVQQ